MSSNSDEERRFMYKINQGHLTVFCIVFVWLGGPPSPVRIMTQVPWFMYQNRLGPFGGIYYPNFVPCFVVLYLNFSSLQSVETQQVYRHNPIWCTLYMSTLYIVCMRWINFHWRSPDWYVSHGGGPLPSSPLCPTLFSGVRLLLRNITLSSSA